MRTLLLARRSLAHHRGRTAILVACIALTMFLPFAVDRLVAVYGTRLEQRAVDTPLIVGAKGSRFDLVLNSLYFRGRVPDALKIGTADAVGADGLALAIPMLARDTAGGWPLVGTVPEYYAFRGLRPAQGTLPLRPGECVVGAQVAVRDRLTVGSTLLTDQKNLYAIDAAYPLKMRVVGVLAPRDAPDDGAVFTSLQTVWIAEGIGHGHADAATQDPARVIRREGEDIVLDSGVVQYQEITPANLDSFHFHGDPAALPVTAILAVPRDVKAATILGGRFRVAPDAQLLVPRDVVREITGFVLRLKTFFDANVALVGIATLLFLGLVTALLVKVRQREIETLVRIGASRLAVLRVFATELGLVVAAGAVAAGVLALVAVLVVERVAPWL